MKILRSILAILTLTTTLGVEYNAGTYRFLDDNGEFLFSVTGFPPKTFSRRVCSEMTSTQWLIFSEHRKGICIIHHPSKGVGGFLHFDPEKNPDEIMIIFCYQNRSSLLNPDVVFHYRNIKTSNHIDISTMRVSSVDDIRVCDLWPKTISLRNLAPCLPAADLNEEWDIELNGTL